MQLSNFGRILYGVEDSVPGFGLSKIKIKETSVIATSGKTEHPIIFLQEGLQTV